MGTIASGFTYISRLSGVSRNPGFETSSTVGRFLDAGFRRHDGIYY